MIVYSRWDRSPDILEDQVTYPIVSAMLGAPKVKDVRGFSDFGYSYVYIIFEEGTDIYWARSRTLEYLSKILPRLPQDVKTELGPDATGVGWVFQYALVRTGAGTGRGRGQGPGLALASARTKPALALTPLALVSCPRMPTTESGSSRPTERARSARRPPRSPARTNPAPLPASNRREAPTFRREAAPLAPGPPPLALAREARSPRREAAPLAPGPRPPAPVPAPSLADLRSLQDWFLRYQLQSVPGVAEVAPLGGFVRQYQVNVDPNRLQAYDIPITQGGGGGARRQQRRGRAPGRVHRRASTWCAAAATRSPSADLEKIVLATSAERRARPRARRGRAWRSARTSAAASPTSTARAKWSRGIVVMRQGENALRVIERVKAKLEEIEPGLPPGVKSSPPTTAPS